MLHGSPWQYRQTHQRCPHQNWDLLNRMMPCHTCRWRTRQLLRSLHQHLGHVPWQLSRKWTWVTRVTPLLVRSVETHRLARSLQVAWSPMGFACLQQHTLRWKASPEVNSNQSDSASYAEHWCMNHHDDSTSWHGPKSLSLCCQANHACSSHHSIVHKSLHRSQVTSKRQHTSHCAMSVSNISNGANTAQIKLRSRLRRLRR